MGWFPTTLNAQLRCIMQEVMTKSCSARKCHLVCELAPKPCHCVCERAPVCGPASRLHVLPFGPAPRRSLEDRHISPLGILTNSKALCASQTVQQRSVPSSKGPNTCLCSDGAVLLCKRRFSMRTRCLKSRVSSSSNFASSLH